MKLFSDISERFRSWRYRRAQQSEMASVLKLYRQADQHVAQFQDKSGLHCVSGCGKCCQNPDVEATVLDLLPLATDLWERGEAENWLNKTKSVSGAGPCVFYQPDALLPGKGRCSVYHLRPLLCRLFGFSAVSDKHGQAVLVTCATIKETCKTEVSNTEQRLADGSNIPKIPDYAQRLSNISPQHGTQRWPINRAAQLAIERIGFLRQFQKIS